MLQRRSPRPSRHRRHGSLRLPRIAKADDLIQPAVLTRLNFAIKKLGYDVTKLVPTGRKLRRMKASDERRRAR